MEKGFFHVVFIDPGCYRKSFLEAVEDHICHNINFSSVKTHKSSELTHIIQHISNPTVFLDLEFPLIGIKTIERFIHTFNIKGNKALLSGIPLYPNPVIGIVPAKEVFSSRSTVIKAETSHKIEFPSKNHWIFVHLKLADSSGVIMCKISQILDKWTEYKYHPENSLLHAIKISYDGKKSTLRIRFHDNKLEDCEVHIKIFEECDVNEKTISMFLEFDEISYFSLETGEKISYSTGEEIVGRQQYPSFLRTDGPLSIVPAHWDKLSYDLIKIDYPDSFHVANKTDSQLAEGLWDRLYGTHVSSGKI